MTSVFKRRGGPQTKEKTQGRSSCDNRGRDWSNAAQAKEHLRPPEAGRGRKDSPPEGTWPCGTVISGSGPRWGPKLYPIPPPGLLEPTLVHAADGGVLSGQVSSGSRCVRDEVRHLGWGRWVESQG